MVKNADVLEMVKLYLIAHEFDGLYSIGECACTVDDLAPCGDIDGDCIAGHFLKSECEEHDFHIGNKTDPDNDPYKCGLC